MSRQGLVWCALCVLTIASTGLAELGRWAEPGSMLIVLMAAAKSRLVIVHYMEVGRAARHWRLLYESWIVAAAATLLIGLWMGSPG